MADFMGHNIRVHRDYYRLPDAATQVAKLSEVLLLMEKGELGRLMGKNLDDLDVDLLNEGDDDVSVNSEAQNSEEDEAETLQPPSQTSGGGKVYAGVPPDPKKQGIVKKRNLWSEAEQAAVRRSCAKHLAQLCVPGKADCMKAINKETVLKGRTWRDVKYRVYNLICSTKRGLFK